jgi:spore coat protein CotF
MHNSEEEENLNMTQNPQGQMHENMHTGPVPPQLNHGGHELFDVHEVLSASVAGLNQYTLLRPHVKDQELLTMMDRQFHFMQEEYNITVECFSTGLDPSKSTQKYMMKQDNDFVFGLKPSQPKKPIQSAAELTDEIISGFMLGVHKSGASLKAMSALETTNPVVRRVLADSVPNCIEMAYEVSIYQNKHHYYQVPQLAQQDTTAIVNSYAPSNIQPNMASH